MSNGKPLSPEILTVIQTAAAVFVATKMQEKRQPDRDSSSWSNQGRSIVQASHNLVQRGH